MSLLHRFTRQWFRRNQGRPTRVPQQLIKPMVEGLEERAVPAVTFTYDSGTNTVAFTTNASPNEFSLLYSTSTDFEFNSDSFASLGNDVAFVTTGIANPPLTYSGPAGFGYAAKFVNTVKISPTLAPSDILYFRGDTSLTGINGTGGTVTQQFTSLNPRTLTITGGSGTSTFAGAVNDGSALATVKLTMNSAGLTQILSGNSDFTGATQISAGTLQVNGKNTNSPVTIGGGTLSGTGTVNTVALSSGTMAPGAATGILNTSDLTFTGGTFIAGLASTSNYSQANVTGTVTLGSATTLTINPTFIPSTGNTFTIINNDGSDAVSGTFKGLAEGAIAASIGGVDYKISYVGGTGNDVVLTAQSSTIATTTSVITSASPSVYGQSVTFTATVTPASGGAPTGTVDFFNGATYLGTGTLNGAGQTTLSTSSLAVGGAYTITANYAGDSTHSGSLGTVSQTVNKADTTTVGISDINPSVTGESVTFTVTVSPSFPGSGIPTGSVTITQNGSPVTSGTLDGSGQISFTTPPGYLQAGTQVFVATYSGDGNFNSSASAPLNQDVNKALTNVLATVSPGSTVFGQSVSITANVFVVAPGAGIPTGTVDFYDGLTLLGSTPLSPSGVATFSTTTLNSGFHLLRAVYTGDSNFNGGQDFGAVTVSQANTTTALVSDVNPSVFGNSVTFTATVAAVTPGAGIPTGFVDFYNGSTLIASAGLDGTGVATISTSTLSPGINQITAVYGGDINFLGSTSLPLPQTVNQPPYFTSAATTTFETGVAGNFNFTAGGYPTNFVFSTTGPLPAGVTLSPAGLLSGTPAAGTGGEYTFTVTVGNGIAPDATQAFSLIVNQPPEFTNVDIAETFYGVPFNFQFTSSGYPTTFSYAVTSGALPSGLTLSPSGDLSGTVTPGVFGTFHFTVQSSNGVSPNAFQNFTLVVTPSGGMYDYNATTGELSISLADDVDLEFMESGGTTTFILTKPGDTPFFVPAPGSAILTGNMTDRIYTTNLAGGLAVNNAQTSTSGTTNDVKFNAGTLETASIKFDLTLNQGYGGISFLAGTKSSLSGNLVTFSSGNVSIDGSLLADTATFNGGILSPAVKLTGPATDLNRLDFGFTTGGSVMLGNSLEDLIQVDQGIITFVPTSLGGLIGTNNSPIYLTEVSLNSETLLDTNNLGGGASITLLGFLQNAHNLILDTGYFDTSLMNASAVDADIVALNGGIELGGLGSSVTFSNNSTITSQTDIIELNGSNYTSTAGNLVSLIADDVAIDLAASLGGSGSYLLSPFNATTKSFLGSASATIMPGLKLSQAEFDTFSTDVDHVQIGQNSYAGTIVSGTLTSANALYLVNNGGGGKVLVNGLLTVTGGDANNLGLYVIGSGSTTVLSANIVTAGVDVLIDDAVQVDGANILIDTTAAGAVPAGANITLTGGTRGIFATLGSTNNLEIDAGTDGTVELGYLRGFGTGGVASLVNNLVVSGIATTIYSQTDLGGDLVVGSGTINLNSNINASGSIDLAGSTNLTNNVALFGATNLLLGGPLAGSGWNLDLASSGTITATSAITDINNLVIADFAGISTFSAVEAQNLNIQSPTNTGAQIVFEGNLTVPGYMSSAAGDYGLFILGSSNTIGGPLTTANSLVVVGNDDSDSTTITNDFHRALPTALQGTVNCGGAVSLTGVSPTIPGAILELSGETIDIGFDTGAGNDFKSVSLSATGDVNLNDGGLATADLNIIAGSISQTYYSVTQVSGLTYLYAYGDINLTAVNDWNLLEVYGNNVTLYTENGVEFNGALISGNLNIYTDNLKGATGNITQTLLGVQVYGDANFYSLGDIVLSNPLNVFTGNVTFSGNSVFLGGQSDINLGGGIANGDLTVNTSFANGDITQSGPLSVLNGLTTLNAGAGSVVLTNVLNDLGDNGAVSITAENAYLTDVDQLLLGTTTVTGDLDIFTQGAITQNGALNIGSWLRINSHSSVTLDNAGNTIGTLQMTADSATVVESGALTLANVLIDEGDLNLTVYGNLDQAGPVQVVSPGALTVINASGFDVNLFDLRNDLVLAQVTGNNVNLGDANNLLLQDSIVTGDLEIFAGQTVSLYGNDVTGNTLISAGQDILGGGNTFNGAADFIATNFIWLDNSASSFVGPAFFGGQQVTVLATGDVELDGGNAAILLDLTTTGNITQSPGNYLNVSGNTILQTTGDILLNDVSNVLVGSIQASGNNITLANSGLILLDTTTATADLTLIAPGGVDQVKPATVGGKLDIQAGGDTVTLLHPENSLPTIAVVANTADIVTQGAVNLLPSTVGTLSLTAGGPVTQTGGLKSNTADIRAAGLAGPADITLTDAGNELRSLSFTGANVQIQDTGYLALGNSFAQNLTLNLPGDIYQTGLLRVSGSTNITANDVTLDNSNNLLAGEIALLVNSAVIANSADIILGDITATNGLTLETPGSISQTGTVMAGAYELFASEGATLNSLGGGTGANQWEGGLLTLTGANNLAGGLTSNGSGVRIEGAMAGTMTVLSGTLSGNGKIGRIDNAKGTVSPTLVVPVANSLTAGTALLEAGSALNLQLNSIVPGNYSQLVVTETILGGESALSIEGAQLNLTPGAKFFGLLGNQVTLIDNQGDNAVNGTFNDLPEGAPILLNGQDWVISYKGGNGNDVVLTRQRFVPPATGPVVAQPFSLGAGSLVASLGNGKVGIWSDDGQYQEIIPFPGYTGPLNVNTLTRSGSTKPDSIVVSVAGPSVPHVLVVDAMTGRVAQSFYAFDPKFLGGVTVAGGVTKIGGQETTVILCGAGAGSAPAVSVFDAVDGYSRGAFYAFSEQYKGGVRVALSQPLADGTSYVVVGSTINSHVVSFLLDDYTNAISSFYAFPSDNCPDGLYVAAADLDDNGTIEIITGAAKGKASPQVAVFSLMGQMKKAFNAFDMSFAGGVRVAVNDMDADGDLDILAASGPGAQGTLNAFNYNNLELIDSMFISDSLNGVAAGNNYIH